MVLVALISCIQPTEGPVRTTPSDTAVPSTHTTSTSTTLVDTGTPSCVLPPMPEAAEPLEAFVPGEYAAIHEDFTLVGSELMGVHLHTGVLQAATVSADISPLVPGFERFVKGITALPDGRLAIADPTVGAVRLVDPATGAQEVVGTGILNPNGVAVGPGGDLTVATLGDIVRIDALGVAHRIASLPGLDLDGIAFSPDQQTLYTDHPGGAVFSAQLGADGRWEPFELFAMLPIASGQGLVFDVADGLVTDVCGNLYVVGMRGSLFRFAPDGTPDGQTALPGQPYELFTAVRFGTGEGGWDAQTAYVTGLHGTVLAVPVGVSGTPR